MPTELDAAAGDAPARPTDPPSRAAEVLDRLVRDRPSGAAPRRAWPPAWPDRRVLLAALGVLATLAVVAAVVLARRPPPIEDRLPVASTTDAADAGTAADAGSDDRLPADASVADAPSADVASTTAAGDAQVVVHVAGAVTSPGVVRLSSGSRVVDAVSAAGGLRADADPDRVNLAAPLTDGQRVVVPVLGQPAPVDVGAGAAGGAAGGVPGDPAEGGAGPVDLNTATADQLDTLPGVGPSTAAAIIDHRDASGPFSSVDELLDVRGIGEAKLEALRDLVTVGGA